MKISQFLHVCQCDCAFCFPILYEDIDRGNIAFLNYNESDGVSDDGVHKIYYIRTRKEHNAKYYNVYNIEEGGMVENL